MKKSISFLFIMLLVVALAACGSGNKNGQGSANGLSSNKTVIVGTNPTFPPFETQDNNGNIVGFDIDLLNAIGKQENLNIQIKTLKFDGLIPALQGGTIDAAISGMTITKARAKHVNFSNAYYKTGLSILTKPDSGIHSFADLKKGGHLVATQKATSSATYLENHGVSESNVKKYGNISGAYNALMNGGADAVIYDDVVNQHFINTHKKANVKTVGKLLTGEYYGIAVNKKEDALLKKLNEGLKKLQQNGTYKKLYDKYFHNPNGFVKGVKKAKDVAVVS